MFRDYLALKGGQPSSPDGGQLGVDCEERAAAGFDVQCSLQNDNAIVASIQLA
jgi:hypothetical protein